MESPDEGTARASTDEAAPPRARPGGTGRATALVALAAIAAGVWKRSVVLAWLEGLPMVKAAVVAAAAGSLVGALTNDSGALFIQVGTLYLALVLGFAWTTAKSGHRSG